MKPQPNPARIFIFGSLDTTEGVKAEGEVGVQRDAQDFRDSIMGIILIFRDAYRIFFDNPFLNYN